LKAKSSATAVAIGLLLGCQPGASPTSTDTPCISKPADISTIFIAPLSCDEQILQNGEGRVGDWVMANAFLRAVIRQPLSAVSTTGIGGMTLVDAAPWGYPDKLHEVIPLVGGGWLQPTLVEALPEGLQVTGRVHSLPHAAAAEEGQIKTVTWKIDEDSPWLRAEGADGLFVHLSGHYELLASGAHADEVLYGHRSSEIEDLGGAFIIHDYALVTAPTESAFGEISEAAVFVSGEAPGAQWLLLFEGDVLTGRLPVGEEGSFDYTIPASVSVVQAAAKGFSPSAPTAPGSDLFLNLGAVGTLQLTGEFPPGWARWSNQEGVVGESFIEPDTVLATGPGLIDLTLSWGPAFTPSEQTIAVEEGSEMSMQVNAEVNFVSETWRSAAFRWPGSRSKTWRGDAHNSLSMAMAQGLDLVVITPEDDVSNLTAPDSDLPFSIRGSSSTHHSRPWTVTSWPWKPNARKGGHGAIDIDDLTPEDALAAAQGGPGTNRTTAIDLPWLQESSSPWLLWPRPDGVFLSTAPSGSTLLQHWQPWFEWLDAAIPITPMGPLTWLEVGQSQALARSDYLAAVTAGRAIASTGPLIRFDVDGLSPGEVLSEEATEDSAHLCFLEILPSQPPLTHALLVTEGGEVLQEWDVDNWPVSLQHTTAELGRWIVALAHSDDGEHWAVSSPIWNHPP